MGKLYTVAVVGATGVVGKELIQILEERNFPVGRLKLLASKRSSGTSTTPILGSIVQKGKFSACAFFEAVKALNKVDLPTFGNPTIPHLKPI